MKAYIEHSMIHLSKNCRITQSAFKIIKEKLNDQELNEFYEWLKIAESERMSEVRNAGKFFLR